jgi:hypothetical protein
MSKQIVFQGELMLLNWSETHNGGAVIKLQLADARDLEAFKLMTVKKGNMAGQLLAAVMVRIDEDDEKPTQKLSQQSALICKSRSFQQFVETKAGVAYDTPEQQEKQAVNFLRQFCEIESRSELDSDGRAGMKYQQLLADYREHLSPGF